MFKILSLLTLLSVHSVIFGLDTVPDFTAVFDSKKKIVTIKWQHKAPNIRSYTLQRSGDNKIWKDIAMKQSIDSPIPLIFFIEDKSPAEGQNYYRLKSVYAEKEIKYSTAITVNTGSANMGWVMYPVPAQDFLTLEYRGAEPIKGVINIFVQQSSGRIIYRLRSSSLNKFITIPVYNLGKGFYDIRIMVQGELVWAQRFVK